MTRFPMLDPPFQVQSKKTRFYAKIFVQFGRSNRPLLTKSACMFYQKDDEKKRKKDVNTLTAKYTVGFLNPFLLSIFAIT